MLLQLLSVQRDKLKGIHIIEQMVRKLQAIEEIKGTTGFSIADFWSWAYSDIMTNTTRAVFAEFLVGSALGVIDEPRKEWDGVDLRYQGKKLEVKSSAYLQAWDQKGLPTIRFDIAKKKSWDAVTNAYTDYPIRASDCFVFCLFTERDPQKADILDVSLWEFYVIPTQRIESELGNQKSIGLSGIQSMCGPVKYTDLRDRIDSELRGF